MKRIKIYAAIAVIAAAAIFTYRWYAARTPEGLIKRQLQELCDCASKSEGDGTTSGILKAHRIGELFAPEAKLEFRAEVFTGQYSPEELASNLTRFRMMFESVKVSMSDLTVSFPSPETAEAEFSGELHGVLKKGGRVDELRELICRLSLIDGVWKINSITVREILER